MKQSGTATPEIGPIHKKVIEFADTPSSKRFPEMEAVWQSAHRDRKREEEAKRQAQEEAQRLRALMD